MAFCLQHGKRNDVAFRGLECVPLATPQSVWLLLLTFWMELMTALRYRDGQEVRLGDTIRWGDEASGVVVVMIAEQEAMPGYEAAE